MNRRMESIKLMAALQPFTQLGYINASQAKSIVDKYKEGDTTSLKELCLNPMLPNRMTPVIERVKQYI